VTGPRGKLSDPAFRVARARYAATVCHAKGKTSTEAGRDAFLARFESDDERRAYMRELAARSVKVRQANPARRREQAA
jgi:hypothetical protein